MAPTSEEARRMIMEAIAREKAAIFYGLETGGVAVLNGDLSTTPILIDAAGRHAAKTVTFGTAPGNHHRLLQVDVHERVTVARARVWRISSGSRRYRA